MPGKLKDSRAAVLMMAASVLVCPQMQAGAAPATEEAPRPKYALLVGIDNYPGSAKLHGAANDVSDMEKLLTQHFGFREDHIVKLLNEQATAEGIMAGFRKHLTENAKLHPDGVFIFQFSGHGVQVPDNNEDEIDGRDESLVTADLKDVLRDDDVAKLLQEIGKYTPNSVFILDCCHSGTGTRDWKRSKMQTRALPDEQTAVLLKNLEQNSRNVEKAKAVAKDSDQGNAILPQNRSRYIGIFACRPEQLAKESTGERRNGVLTKSLVAALSKSPRPQTYEQLWEEVSSVAQLVGQTPCFEGDWHRPVFGMAGERGETLIKVLDASSTSVVLAAGASSGLSEGTPVAFYPPGTASSGSARIAEGKISVVRPTTSDVQLSLPFKDTEALKHSRAALLGAPPSAQPVAVKIKLLPGSESAAVDFANRLRERLRTNKLADLQRDDATAASAEIVVGTAKQLGQYSIGNMPAREMASLGELQCAFFTVDGTNLLDRATGIKGEETLIAIDEALSKRAVVQRLRTLSNTNSPLRDSFEVKFLRVAKVSQDGQRVEEYKELPEDQGVRRDLKDGEMFQFSMANKSNLTLYPALVLVAASGHVDVLFPAEGNLKEGLPPGQIVKTDVFTASEPFGLESFKFIVTTQPTDYRFLTNSGVTRSLPGEAGSALGEFLQGQLSNATTRNVKKAPQSDQWMTVLWECFTHAGGQKHGQVAGD